jgi:hypothetical protein
MLKRIALTAVIVATAAFAGLGVAKAQSSGTKAKTTVQFDTAAKGFCPNMRC